MEQPSYKMTAIGCDQTKVGKEGLKLIIKDDIVSNDYRFWVEASGKVENYFERFGGYKVHNIYASWLLKTNDITLCEDGFHYTREIGSEGETFTKIIYGFKDEDLYEYINNTLTDKEFYCGKLIESKMTEDIKEKVKNAYSVIDTILRSHEEDGVNELFPNWYRSLVDARNTLKKYEVSSKIKNTYIEYADFLLDTMTLIELRPLILD